jgi:hypothetical protein
LTRSAFTVVVSFCGLQRRQPDLRCFGRLRLWCAIGSSAYIYPDALSGARRQATWWRVLLLALSRSEWLFLEGLSCAPSHAKAVARSANAGATALSSKAIASRLLPQPGGFEGAIPTREETLLGDPTVSEPGEDRANLHSHREAGAFGLSIELNKGNHRVPSVM